MCTDADLGSVPPVTTAVPDAPWSGEVVALAPVDSVKVTTICDNTVDIFLVDEVPAHRLLSHVAGPPPTLPAPTLLEGRVIDSPRPSTASPPTSPSPRAR